jgi:hypothetical protein
MRIALFLGALSAAAAAPVVAHADDAIYTIFLDSSALTGLAGTIQLNSTIGTVDSFDLTGSTGGNTYTFTNLSGQSETSPGAENTIQGSLSNLTGRFTLDLYKNGTYYLASNSTHPLDDVHPSLSVPASPASAPYSLLLIGIGAVGLVGAAQRRFLRP